MNVLVVFYSLYGHVSSLAQAVAEGVDQVPGAVAVLRRVPETLTPETIEKMGAAEAQRTLRVVPECTLDELAQADAILFGTPTRFGNMCGQMRQFLDATGGLWAKGALVGKPGGVFCSTGTQHGGQETTLVSFICTLMHHGMLIVGLPYSFSGQTRVDEITGGSPYGATTIAGPDGGRMPSENELDAARFQGRHLAMIAAKLQG
ncbi:NAD(P)H:quinone oxidoreductase [Desulfolutivibrio sulfoxidireducens]|uniref:NAD(P)H:quinone oxidoreductase n=1 Tax=Desulfolutivibrio sulfoxidireducens TaxID=2773299 RepID=UPI00159D6BD6|nr:NAD(P)H:quinone oxidoreductase [Desulfolutivibrio sulfoxidireducens]QLA17641.1 NAD(P)H:quinone oxidoreductase [Desulfolutivibrio sulfoxidireducens]QLA21213.1 NAD(P)H:quinone oxidoreductase [Desulfolutivibrio sulfoxidireducens]